MLKIKQFIFNPIQENTYVLYTPEGACAIVDPGCYFDSERKELADFIAGHKLTPKYLLNTHCHLDHVFGDKFVAETYGLSLQLHPGEKEMLEMAPVVAQQWGLPFEPYQGELVFLEEGSRLALGDYELEVLLTPGHSPASISFYCEEQRLLLAGDVLFQMSIGRTDLPGGDHDTLLASIREKLFVLPDEVRVYPGHGDSTTIGHEKKHNPFLI